MVHSMTAFARTEGAEAHGTLSWELRSVNHRYLEPHLRLPEAFRDLEGAVREALRQGLSRGKVECTLRFAEENAGRSLQVDGERARQLVEAAEQVAALIRQPAPLNPLEVLAWPGVLVADAADPQALNAAALQLFEQALGELKNGRAREGAELARLLNERLDGILQEVAALRELVPEMLANQRQKIETRFAEMRAELDPSAWSRNWCCWRRKATWPRNWTACPPTSPRCAACSRPAAPPAAAWTSSCRNSTARPTPWAPRPSTRAAPRQRSTSRS